MSPRDLFLEEIAPALLSMHMSGARVEWVHCSTATKTVEGSANYLVLSG